MLTDQSNDIQEYIIISSEYEELYEHRIRL